MERIKQALDKALAEKPDLIITDLKMPRMTGLEMMAALSNAGANIPVILTTFYGSEQTAIEAFRLGAKDYMIKPYDPGEMLESVEGGEKWARYSFIGTGSRAIFRARGREV